MKKEGIPLWSINKVLRKIGFVVVVCHPTSPDDPDQETRVWIERARTFDNRKTYRS